MPLTHTCKGKVEAFFLSTNDYEDILVLHRFALTTDATILFYIKDSLRSSPSAATNIARLPGNVVVESYEEEPFIPTTDRVISFTDENGQLYLRFSKGISSPGKLLKLLSDYPNRTPIVDFVDTDSKFYITGGDTIVGDDFIIFGPMTTELQRKYLTTNSWETYHREFEKQYHYSNGSLRFLMLKETGYFQSGLYLYHLDLFLNYLGEDRNGQHLFIIGEIPAEMLNQANNKEDLIHYQKYINEVEEQLICFFGDGKINIERIPLIPGYDRDFGNFWGFHSHNNVVAEVTQKSSQLILPYYTNATYSQYDQEHTKTTELLDYYVDDIKKLEMPWEALQASRASIHCFAAVLARV